MSAVATPAPAPAPRKAGRKARTTVRPCTGERAPETVAAALRRELLITFECNRVEFVGTAQQFVDEGVLPAGFEFPAAFDRKEGVNVPGCPCAWVKREKLPGTGEHLKLVDRWIVQAWMPDNRRRKPYSAADHWAYVAEFAMFIGTTAGLMHATRFSEAQLDRHFQRVMDFDSLVKAAEEAL